MCGWLSQHSDDQPTRDWLLQNLVEASWNVMAHAQKPNSVFRRNGPSPFKSAGGRQFSRMLAAEVCASAVVMLDTPCSEVVWRVLATHSIRQFPLHFPSRASTCAITFQLDPNTEWLMKRKAIFWEMMALAIVRKTRLNEQVSNCEWIPRENCLNLRI